MVKVSRAGHGFYVDGTLLGFWFFATSANRSVTVEHVASRKGFTAGLNGRRPFIIFSGRLNQENSLPIRSGCDSLLSESEVAMTCRPGVSDHIHPRDAFKGTIEHGECHDTRRVRRAPEGGLYARHVIGWCK